MYRPVISLAAVAAMLALAVLVADPSHAAGIVPAGPEARPVLQNFISAAQDRRSNPARMSNAAALQMNFRPASGK